MKEIKVKQVKKKQKKPSRLIRKFEMKNKKLSILISNLLIEINQR